MSPFSPSGYLGADGHLVALREGDLAFKDGGRVHTAEFTRAVGP